MDYYSWIKALHLISIVVLIGGMLLNGFLFRNIVAGTPEADRVLGSAVTFNRTVVGIALGVVWIAGLWLVWQSGFYRDGWFMAKFVLVFALSGIHGAQTGGLNRMRQNPGKPASAFFQNSGLITLLLVAIVICLVAVKPF